MVDGAGALPMGGGRRHRRNAAMGLKLSGASHYTVQHHCGVTGRRASQGEVRGRNRGRSCGRNGNGAACRQVERVANRRSAEDKHRARPKPLFALRRRVRSPAGPPLAARHGYKASARQRSPAANKHPALHGCGLGSISAASSYQTPPEEADAPRRNGWGGGAQEAWHHRAAAVLSACSCACWCACSKRVVMCSWSYSHAVFPHSLVDTLLHRE